MGHKTSFVNKAGFAYNAEVRELVAMPGAFSFAITSVWRSAKNSTAEKKALQITLSRANLIALRDLIDVELQA